MEKKKKNEFRPKKHEIEGNFNYFSEEISKNIIEKIISFVISCDLKKKVEDQYEEFSFNLMKKTLDNIIEISHINHEKDDFDIDNIEISTFIKTNKSDTDIKRYLLSKHNIALENRNNIVEQDIMKIADIPKDFKTYMFLKNKKIEDCLNKSTNIEKNKYLKKPKKVQYDINISKSNFWNDIPCPPVCDIDRTSSRFNTFIPIKESHQKIDSNITKGEENKKNEENKNNEKNKSLYRYKNFISKLSRNLSFFKGVNESKFQDILFRKKKKTHIMVDLPSYPIENIKIRKENDEIINLRKERIEMKIQMEKEKRKIELIKMEKMKEEAKKASIIRRGNVTFDNEGNLLLINGITQDKLSKEFCPVETKQKDIKEGKSLGTNKKEIIKMKKEAMKNIIYNEEDYNNNDSSHIKSRSIDAYEFRRYDDFFFDRFNNKKLEPSGSNFKLINPSVGVLIKEKNLIKSGGNDYYKEFHKHSIDEFDKSSKGNIELAKYDKKETQNDSFKTTTPNILKHLKINNLKKKFDEKKADESSSIIDVIKNNKNYFKRITRNILNKNKQNNLGNTSSDGFFSNQNKKSMLSSSSQIILKNKKFVNLKQLLFHDNKDEFTNESYNKLIKGNKSFSNLFSRNKIQIALKQKNKLLNIRKMFYDIDKFNKSIITGKATLGKIFNNKKGMVLPKLSKKNEETNFKRNIINFIRERTKKVIWD